MISWNGTTTVNLSKITMTDDDLRFGDVDGNTETGDRDIADLIRQVVILLLGAYIVLKMLEILFNVPVPMV